MPRNVALITSVWMGYVGGGPFRRLLLLAAVTLAFGCSAAPLQPFPTLAKATPGACAGAGEGGPIDGVFYPSRVEQDVVLDGQAGRQAYGLLANTNNGYGVIKVFVRDATMFTIWIELPNGGKNPSPPFMQGADVVQGTWHWR